MANLHIINKGLYFDIITMYKTVNADLARPISLFPN